MSQTFKQSKNYCSRANLSVYTNLLAFRTTQTLRTIGIGIREWSADVKFTTTPNYASGLSDDLKTAYPLERRREKRRNINR